MRRWPRRDVYAEVIADRKREQEEAASNGQAVSGEEEGPVAAGQQQQAETAQDRQQMSKVARIRDLTNYVLMNMGIEHVYGPRSRP